MCENNPDCKFHRVAVLAAQYARARIESTRLALEQALREAGFDIPVLSFYQRNKPRRRMARFAPRRK